MKAPRKALTILVFMMILGTDVLESFAEIFFKKATLSTGLSDVTLGNGVHFAASLLSSGSLWLGVLIYCLNFLLWMLVLTKIDLSLAFPAGSVTYVIVPVLSILTLHEHVSALRWLGCFLIVVGVFFISLSKSSKEGGLL